MSVFVKSISLSSSPKWIGSDPHELAEDINVLIAIEKDEKEWMVLQFALLQGFKCDGASIPWAFRWFLPSWAEEGCGFSADTYNIGSAIHDGLYIHKGFGLLSREECDDVLRGIWRLSGISRFKAGVADKCVEWFAGGGKHWGNDSYDVADKFTMVM